MQSSVIKLAKALLIGAAVFGLQACSPVATSSNSDVATAFESSGMLSVQPYTRTIFSTNNF